VVSVSGGYYDGRGGEGAGLLIFSLAFCIVQTARDFASLKDALNSNSLLSNINIVNKLAGFEEVYSRDEKG
jgi:hypothetical protein